MKYDFEKKLDRRNTDSIKWDYFQDFIPAEDCLPMWVADMDLPAPQEVGEAIIERAKHPVFGYTKAGDSLLQAIINWMQKRFEWKIDTDWITITHDVVSTINLIILNFTDEKDKILIQTPVYGPFAKGIKSHNRTLVEAELVLKNNKYQIDFEDLEEKFRSGVKLMIFCSPHNPVGRVWTESELQKIAALCVEYDVLVISDEIHADLVLPGNIHIPFAKINSEIAQKTITLYSGAKTFNIAGLKTSTAIISNPELKKKFDDVINSLELWGGNIFGYEAMKAAYNFGEDWLEQVLIHLAENKKVVVDFFAEKFPQVKIIDSEATFLLWLDWREMFVDLAELEEFIYQKAKLGLLSGTAFGKAGKGFMRMNIACSKSIINEALKRLESADDD